MKMIKRHKLLWDFDIQTDHLISARRTDHRIKLKESKKTDKYLDVAMEYESDVYINCNWCS